MILLEDILTNNRERNYHQVFEEYGESINRNRILPGHYYRFQIDIPNLNRNWIPNSIDEWKESPESFITKKQYLDLNPVGLLMYHDKWQENALILNLRAVTPIYRSKIILTHLNLIEESLNRMEVFNKNAKTIPFEERGRINLPLFQVTPSVLEQASGVKLRGAIDAYKMDKISRAKVLDWDNIGELPLASLEDRGIALSPGTFGIERIFEQFENKQIL